MLRKYGWIILSCLMALSLILASCTTTEEEEEEEEGPPVTEEEEEEEEKPPVSGDWWDKFGEPEYGDTILYHVTSLPTFTLDNWKSWSGEYCYTSEPVWMKDWTLDRGIWDFRTSFTAPQYWTGNLAESWEQPDMQTVIVHLREGILWQDKPPVNGREFTAYDVEYHYDRLMGTGHGFTAPSAWHASRMKPFEKVTATDKYTLVYKFEYPTAWGMFTVLEVSGQNYIEPPELVEMVGGFDDWRNLAGTGPWIMTDFVASSSETFVRNPTYWGYDERHPENQLPYADTVRVLCIADTATSIAAVRTGKIDILQALGWEQAASVARTNTELLQATRPWPGPSLELRVDLEPFTDIRVRKAMQMAIDRETIAQTIYGGTIDGIPCGLIHPLSKGYCFSYEEWPQELKDEYSYNPERARELLTEAGYPEGFKTSVQASGSGINIDVLQVIKAELMDVGIDLEIEMMESGTLSALLRSRQHTIRYDSRTGIGSLPKNALNLRYSTDQGNENMVNDPGFDAIVDGFNTSTDMEEARQLVVQADRYALEHHWALNVFPVLQHTIYQPYLKGYSGESLSGVNFSIGWILARFWIDQDMKKAMRD